MPQSPWSGLSIMRISQWALIKCHIINIQHFLGAGLYAACQLLCGAGTASSSQPVSSIHQQV